MTHKSAEAAVGRHHTVARHDGSIGIAPQRLTDGLCAGAANESRQLSVTHYHACRYLSGGGIDALLEGSGHLYRQ